MRDHAEPADDSSSADGFIDDVLAALVGRADLTADDWRQAVETARTHAASILDAAGDGQGRGVAALTLAAQVLAALWLDRRWSRSEVDALTVAIAKLIDAPEASTRMALYGRTVRDPQLFHIPPQLASEVILSMLAAFGGVDDVSLWVGEGHAPVSAIAVGESAPSRRAKDAAADAIRRRQVVTGLRKGLHAVPVSDATRTRAALVFRSSSERRAIALAYAREAAYALGPLLEVDALLDRNAERERSLVGASERRLVRVAFDLHDGPMQDLAALAQDTRHFRAQVAEVLDGSAHRELVLGRVDDLEARLLGLDRELREIAGSLQTPTVLRTPLAELVERELESFGDDAGMQVSIASTGDFEGLTSSQKIALLRVVQEALANAREHSGAASVRVTLTATRAHLAVGVVDDGTGFDVDRRLVEAARGGRLGLVGMGERVRLLGGRFEVESAPGGPTSVRAAIPRWRPIAGGEAGEL